MLNVTGTLDVQGSIDVDDRGLRGGSRVNQFDPQGETYDGTGTSIVRTVPANTGGGIRGFGGSDTPGTEGSRMERWRARTGWGVVVEGRGATFAGEGERWRPDPDHGRDVERVGSDQRQQWNGRRPERRRCADREWGRDLGNGESSDGDADGGDDPGQLEPAPGWLRGPLERERGRIAIYYDTKSFPDANIEAHLVSGF